MKVKFAIAALGATVLGAGSAQAGLVEEARLGVTAHNICVIDCKNADIEEGPNVSAELVFASPDFLSWAFSPRPYLNTSINTSGATSFVSGGLQWEFNFTDRLSFAPGLGYTVHNGETNNPYANGTPEAAEFAAEHVLLGSEDLFRTSFALHYQMTERVGVEALYEHYSHGQILGDGRNQGMDNLGLRFSYTFD